MLGLGRWWWVVEDVVDDGWRGQLFFVDMGTSVWVRACVLGMEKVMKREETMASARIIPHHTYIPQQ